MTFELKYFLKILCLMLIFPLLHGQEYTLIKAKWVFDGQDFQNNKVVLIKGDTIVAFDEEGKLTIPPNCKRLNFPEGTLMPGMIEGHAHMLLHPYNETSWNDQILLESQAERSIRGAVHAQKTLFAGFTTVRDLGSEGAEYADVGLKESIIKGIVQGPRLLVAGK
nr:amidohydrolase family protein [Saprospiraceae bacterium]